MAVHTREPDLMLDVMAEFPSGTYWPTPLPVVVPLIRHLPKVFTYCDPCYGGGHLDRHLQTLHPQAILTKGFDIEPRHPDTLAVDARAITLWDMTSPIQGEPDFILTNLPWNSHMIGQMLDHFLTMRPAWVMTHARWILTRSYAQRSHFCRKIVVTPRTPWIPNSEVTGMLDGVWCYFEPTASKSQAKFYPLQDKTFRLQRRRRSL